MLPKSHSRVTDKTKQSKAHEVHTRVDRLSKPMAMKHQHCATEISIYARHHHYAQDIERNAARSTSSMHLCTQLQRHSSAALQHSGGALGQTPHAQRSSYREPAA